MSAPSCTTPLFVFPPLAVAAAPVSSSPQTAVQTPLHRIHTRVPRARSGGPRAIIVRAEDTLPSERGMGLISRPIRIPNPLIHPRFVPRISRFLRIWLGVLLVAVGPRFLKFAPRVEVRSRLQRDPMTRVARECLPSSEVLLATKGLCLCCTNNWRPRSKYLSYLISVDIVGPEIELRNRVPY